jgi:hypothetical protein
LINEMMRVTRLRWADDGVRASLFFERAQSKVSGSPQCPWPAKKGTNRLLDQGESFADLVAGTARSEKALVEQELGGDEAGDFRILGELAAKAG